MSCMCGDTQCGSCGPAQGNFRCPICRAWADSGCDHLNPRTGNVKRKFRKEVEIIEAAERAADEQFANELKGVW